MTLVESARRSASIAMPRARLFASSRVEACPLLQLRELPTADVAG
jgi:hypothetical protein